MNILEIGLYPAHPDIVFHGLMRVVFHLSHALSRYDDLNVTVMTPHRMRYLVKGPFCLHDTKPVVLQCGYASFLGGMLFRHSFDVIHIHGVSLFTGMALSHKLRRTRARLLYTAHGLVRMEREMGFLYPSWMEKMEGALLRGVDAVTTVSDMTRCYLETRYRLDPSSVAVIPNGVDITAFRPEDRPQRTGKRESSLNLLFVGSLLPVKGIEFLFRTMKLLENRNVRLRMAGRETDYYRTLAERYRSLFDRGVVEYLGELDQKRLKEAYAGCDCLILPSYYDQCPQVMLEAMATGKPVIISDRIGSRDLVQHGVNGYIVPYGNPDQLAAAVEKFMENNILTDEMGRAARLRMVSNTWDHIANRYRQLFPTI